MPGDEPDLDAILGDGVGADLDAAMRWVDDWEAGVTERARHAADLSRRIQGMTATAHSQDGLIRVTVASSGALAGLRLDERVRRHSASFLAEQILSTVQAARSDLTEQVRRAVHETLGPDSDTGRAIIASVSDRPAANGARATDGGDDVGR